MVTKQKQQPAILTPNLLPGVEQRSLGQRYLKSNFHIEWILMSR